MGRIFQRTLRATRESIAEAAEDLATWLDAERIPPPAALLARLALDELATNLARHGAGSDVSMRIECRASPDELRIHVEDDGPAFDPRTAPAPDVDGPVEGRRSGGLGLHLLRELADSFEYARVHDRNRVTLAKRRDP